MENEKELIEELTSRFNELVNIRSQFEPSWTEAQKYVAPSVYSWTDRDAIPTTPKRFASEPCKYMKTLVSGLIGYSISPSIKWFKLTLDNRDDLDKDGVKDWLESCDIATVDCFTRSNLYREVTGFIEDAMVLGHSVMLIDEDLQENKIRYTHMKTSELYLDVNGYGKVDTVFRSYRLTLRQAAEMYGIENLDQRLQDDYKDPKKRSQKIDLLFAVYPRKEYNENLKDAKNKPYAAITIDMSNSKVIEESGYDEFPYAVYEFKRIPGYPYSESLSKDALPDIKFLNIAKETSLKIAQTSAEPPMKASNHLKHISVVPKGLTLLERSDDVLEPIKTGDNYPITLEILADLKQTIKDWYQVDFFLMLEAATNKQMTATEVMERQGEKAAVLSDLIVSMNDSLSQIIKRTFNLLLKRGEIPIPPDSLAGTQDVSMRIEYDGPLSQAQKRYYSTGTITNSLAAAAQVIQFFPNSADYIDADTLIKKTMENTGMPESVIREDRDVKKIREERAAAQQQALQMQQQQQLQQDLMSNSDKLNQKVNPGSTLDQLNQQLASGIGANQ